MEFNIFYNDNTPTNRVAIYLDENTNRFCYVNFTKGQVCRCRFNSVELALRDLLNYPQIKGITFINNPSKIYLPQEFITAYLYCFY